MEYEEYLHLEELKINIRKLEIENNQFNDKIRNLEENRTIRGKQAPQFVIVKAINNYLEKIKENKRNIKKLKIELEKKLYELENSGGFLSFPKEENLEEKEPQLTLID